MSETPLWIGVNEIFARGNFLSAVRAVQRELKAGLDPAVGFTRQVLDLANGQLLLMPAGSKEFVGVKVSTVAPGNLAIGFNRVQGIYVLMDALTLCTLAILDGAALTTLRTPAVSAAVVDDLAPTRVENMVVFGSGPQAYGHVEALRSIRDLGRVTLVARNHDRALALAKRVSRNDLDVRIGRATDVRDAQLIVCATTARAPLFDGTLVPDDSCIVAVGSHEPTARELPSELIQRAQLVVEDTTVALREAGDLIIPINEGLVDAESLVPMRDIVTGATSVDHSRPRVFKSSGMAWEDLVVATEVYGAC
jgi:ornithine cyclodeaminase/alanine dehydrogenase-like protein (mu-crystallin family)